MGEVIIAILMLLGSFGGGFVIGKNKADRQHDKAVLELLETSKVERLQMVSRLDSLKEINNKTIDLLEFSKGEEAKINAKLDSLERLPKKVDTLILVSKDIYANTDTIKNELRQFIGK